MEEVQGPKNESKESASGSGFRAVKDAEEYDQLGERIRFTRTRNVREFYPLEFLEWIKEHPVLRIPPDDYPGSWLKKAAKFLAPEDEEAISMGLELIGWVRELIVNIARPSTFEKLQLALEEVRLGGYAKPFDEEEANARKQLSRQVIKRLHFAFFGTSQQVYETVLLLKLFDEFAEDVKSDGAWAGMTYDEGARVIVNCIRATFPASGWKYRAVDVREAFRVWCESQKENYHGQSRYQAVYQLLRKVHGSKHKSTAESIKRDYMRLKNTDGWPLYAPLGYELKEE